MNDTAPVPGVYRDVPFASYETWPYVNASSLDAALVSLEHYQTQTNESTAAMTFGSAVHTLALQPRLWSRTFAVEPDFLDELQWSYRAPERSDEYRGLVAEWRKRVEADGLAVVSRDDYDRALQAAAAIKPALRSVAKRGRRELSLVAKCPHTGLMLKGRLDYVFGRKTDRNILDIKTTANLRGFEASIVRYGYHRQLAFYSMLWESLHGDRPTVWLLAAESREPYGTDCRPVDESTIEAGRAEVWRALKTISGDPVDRGPRVWSINGSSHTRLQVNGRVV